VRYDEQANGTEITAHVNEDFEVALSEVRTAGYRWTILENGEPTLKLTAEENLSNTAGVGGAGQHQWRFHAGSPGETEIKMQYARSWQKTSEPARTFVLKVRVQS